MGEYLSDEYQAALVRVREWLLTTPEFWEHNATLHREPVFAQACLNYARNLRKAEYARTDD